MQAEDDADASKEVVIGYVGDEDEDGEDENRSARVSPHENVADLLHCVDDCVDHAQHQLDYLLHLEHLLNQARQLFPYLESLVMDLELPVLKLLALGQIGLLEFAVNLQRVILLEFDEVLRPLDELEFVGIDAHGLFV